MGCNVSELSKIIKEQLEKGLKPTEAVAKALELYNNSRAISKGRGLRTAWRHYAKLKGSRK